MNGVEILSSETIYETEMFLWLIPLCAGIGLLIGLICFVIVWINYGFDGDFLMTTIALVIAGACLGALLAMFSNHKTDTVDYIEYKVTIDDSVSMNEFLDKYEILDQEGKIYTVKEKG